VDLHDLHHNTALGLHIASLAGAWIAIVEGFGGLRRSDGVLHLDPVLPDQISRLSFRLRWRGRRIQVDVDRQEVTCSLLGEQDAPVALSVCGEAVQVAPGRPVVRPLRRREALLPRPPQPIGCAPRIGADEDRR
jgi:trehalose/maltose hydrolase-like predicted phosphorylase